MSMPTPRNARLQSRSAVISPSSSPSAVPGGGSGRRKPATGRWPRAASPRHRARPINPAAPVTRIRATVISLLLSARALARPMHYRQGCGGDNLVSPPSCNFTRPTACCRPAPLPARCHRRASPQRGRSCSSWSPRTGISGRTGCRLPGPCARRATTSSSRPGCEGMASGSAVSRRCRRHCSPSLFSNPFPRIASRSRMKASLANEECSAIKTCSISWGSNSTRC